MVYTPEPWKILKVDEQGYVSSPEGKDLAIAAGGIIAEVFYRIDDDIYADVEANARMMVNAPGMFNALKALGAKPDGYCFCSPFYAALGHTGECNDAVLALTRVEGDQS